ncbi:hypothetical protein MID00_20580 [Alcaligenes sp. NLF5-7]|uniref:hypothetical protein n=1 Tax=Alcaligenes sp. NLF5-7 TaxID=2918755 RepID=UPI0020C22394|nr:hypothetical protein [Alcaligenes sp. NLF5-7]UTM01846.1 hypothetical protein MID00_20580 [Alcaligenes sp. NLF5-7]
MNNAQDDFYTLIAKAAEPYAVLRDPVEEGQLPAMPYLLFSLTQGRPGPSHYGRVNDAGVRHISVQYQAWYKCDVLLRTVGKFWSSCI